MFDLEHLESSKDLKRRLPISEAFDGVIEILVLIQEFAHHTGNFIEMDAGD